MKAKNDYKAKIYHNGEFDENNILVPENYADQLVNALHKYTHTHPKVMQQRIAAVNWKFNYNETKNKLSAKDHFKNITEKLFGVRLFDYKNYKVV